MESARKKCEHRMNTGNRRVASAGVGAAYTRSGAKGTGLWMEASASVAQTRRRSSRRILNDNQKREVIRLYSETTTSVPEMAKRFGIGESSLYRLVQQHAVPRRGSNSAGTQAVSSEEQLS